MKKNHKQKKKKSPEYLYVVFDDVDRVLFASSNPFDVLSNVSAEECECLVYRFDGTVKLRCNVMVEDIW